MLHVDLLLIPRLRIDWLVRGQLRIERILIPWLLIGRLLVALLHVDLLGRRVLLARHGVAVSLALEVCRIRVLGGLAREVRSRVSADSVGQLIEGVPARVGHFAKPRRGARALFTKRPRGPGRSFWQVPRREDGLVIGSGSGGCGLVGALGQVPAFRYAGRLWAFEMPLLLGPGGFLRVKLVHGADREFQIYLACNSQGLDARGCDSKDRKQVERPHFWVGIKRLKSKRRGMPNGEGAQTDNPGKKGKEQKKKKERKTKRNSGLIPSWTGNQRQQTVFSGARGLVFYIFHVESRQKLYVYSRALLVNHD